MAQKTRPNKHAGGLARYTFDRILDVLRHLGVYRLSPKFFVIYAHENEHVDLQAHQALVKDYIGWFKKVCFNVDSDKSPHGYGESPNPAHAGASVDIVRNQTCLLPRRWHEENVDYVLVFYSELLAKYMEDERGFVHDGMTYMEALYKACDKYLPEEVPWEKVCDDIHDIQKIYFDAMGDKFHHVLTELGLLRFTNAHRAVKYTVPIILFGDDSWEPQRRWQPTFVRTEGSQIRLPIQLENDYPKFFKILLEFESLENDRPLIEALSRCFEESIDSLAENPNPNKYRSRLEVRITQALQNLNNTRRFLMQRPIDIGGIRDMLSLHSMLERASIQRLSGEVLPDNLSDIDLAVVEKPDTRNQEPKAKQIVSIHNLFDERVSDGKTIQPRRILIHGRPGIGKTTLCKRIMYEYSWQESLCHKFELVVRIPVRKLRDFSDLGELLFDEYFQTSVRGHELATLLTSTLLDKEKAEVLLILDGLDEAHGWPHENRGLLDRLLNRPVLITTSRSPIPPTQPVELHLEALGLSMTSVDIYLENTESVSEDTAAYIHYFIRSNPFVQGMAQVPIHLDILCSSRDELQRQNKTSMGSVEGEKHDLRTITALYQAVVRTMWRKDIPQLGKLDHGEPVTREIVDAVRDAARLERLVHLETEFLEEIAISMLDSDRFEFSDQDVNEVIRRLESDGARLPLSLERNISILSVIRPHYRKSGKAYSFFHLTFQEYFAARCLARDRARLKANLRQHKYNRRYEIVWRFVPGLLSSTTELDFFFDLLEKEPRDLVGTQHVQLSMDCLNECRHRISHARRNLMHTRLSEWLKLDMIFHSWRSDIGASMAFPETILLENLGAAMNQGTHDDKDYLLNTIIDRTLLSEDGTVKLLQLLQHDHDILRHFLNFRGEWRGLSPKAVNDTIKEFRLIEILRRHTLGEDTISFFMEVLRSPVRSQVKAAKSVLQAQRHLSSATFKELQQWLMSGDSELRSKAIDILGQRSNISLQIVDCALDLLKNPDPDSRLTGVEILKRKYELPKKATIKLLDWLESAVCRDMEVDSTRDGVLRILRNQALEQDDLERLGKVLQQSIDQTYQAPPTDTSSKRKDAPSSDDSTSGGDSPASLQGSIVGWDSLKRQVIEAMETQPILPTSNLKILVRLLLDKDPGIRNMAMQLLQRQPQLGPEVVDQLKKLFESGQEAAILAMKGRPEILDEIFQGWILTQIAEKTDKCGTVIECLRGQANLPSDLVQALLELAYLPHVNPYDFASLIGEQNNLSPEVVNTFVDLIGSYESFDILSGHAALAIYSRPAFARPLKEVLVNAEIKDLVAYAGETLSWHQNLDDESKLLLSHLLDGEPGDTLAAAKARAAYRVLCKQVELHKDTIQALHTSIQRHEIGYTNLWEHRHIEQFCDNLETFGDFTIRGILTQALLDREAEDVTPAYIDGNTLWFYGADGKLRFKLLENEKEFRQTFRNAQKEAGVPEWAWIEE